MTHLRLDGLAHCRRKVSRSCRGDLNRAARRESDCRRGFSPSKLSAKLEAQLQRVRSPPAQTVTPANQSASLEDQDETSADSDRGIIRTFIVRGRRVCAGVGPDRLAPHGFAPDRGCANRRSHGSRRGDRRCAGDGDQYGCALTSANVDLGRPVPAGQG
jgi:hypothetical protein